ncbi:unnamed protein product [Rotaria sp. Silwood1]|nr:unnamed protein product [Rotaria sp. Silwood1]
MQHSNSILIVEDAEHIILDRKQETFLPKQAVSNLLNLSDGLLGDAMHQQIICTFNCDVQAIDPALLRDGRLFCSFDFLLEADDEREEVFVKERYLDIAKKNIKYNFFCRGRTSNIDINKRKKKVNRSFIVILLEKRRTQGEKDRAIIPLLAWIRSLPTVDKSLDADHDSYAFILALTRELAQ